MGEEAENARKCQQHWKLLLRQQVIRYGAAITSTKLLDHGSKIANEVNVRNWMFPRSIKTQSFIDFQAIMRLINLEHKAIYDREEMEKIDSAHRSAGFKLRKHLLEQVDKSDLSVLKRKGIMNFKLSNNNGLQMSAYRIVNILPQTFNVSDSRIGDIFQLEKRHG